MWRLDSWHPVGLRAGLFCRYVRFDMFIVSIRTDRRTTWSGIVLSHAKFTKSTHNGVKLAARTTSSTPPESSRFRRLYNTRVSCHFTTYVFCVTFGLVIFVVIFHWCWASRYFARGMEYLCAAAQSCTSCFLTTSYCCYFFQTQTLSWDVSSVRAGQRELMHTTTENQSTSASQDAVSSLPNRQRTSLLRNGAYRTSLACVAVKNASKDKHFGNAWQLLPTYLYDCVGAAIFLQVFGIDTNSFCTVLKLCNGDDLELILRRSGTIPEKEAKLITLQIFKCVLLLAPLFWVIVLVPTWRRPYGLLRSTRKALFSVIVASCLTCNL